MPPSPSPEAPWRAGLRAARVNLLPGFLVQAAMVGTVLAYYFLPASRPVFDALAEAFRRAAVGVAWG